MDRILDCASFSVSEAEVFSAVMAWLEATAQRHGMEPTPQKYRLVSLTLLNQLLIPSSELYTETDLAFSEGGWVYLCGFTRFY